MIETKLFALAFSFGALGGCCMAALLYYWLWNMRPSKLETELFKSDIRDLRNDVASLHGKVQRLDDRLFHIEEPPFRPKFGDMVMAEKHDKSGMWPAVYLFTQDKLHRVVARKEGGEVVEYFTDTIEPLDD